MFWFDCKAPIRARIRMDPYWNHCGSETLYGRIPRKEGQKIKSKKRKQKKLSPIDYFRKDWRLCLRSWRAWRRRAWWRGWRCLSCRRCPAPPPCWPSGRGAAPPPTPRYQSSSQPSTGSRTRPPHNRIQVIIATQCFGSLFGLDQDSIGSTDPDSGRSKLATQKIK